MLIYAHARRRSALPGQRHADNLRLEVASRLRSEGAQLAAQRETILIFAGYVEIRCDILGGFRHRIDPIALLENGVDEAPAHGRVKHLGIARERGGTLRHYIRGAAHALRSARQYQLCFTRSDHACSAGNGIHPGAA